MRHGKSRRKLGVSSEHRASLLRNLATDLILHEQIVTTLPKAKELRPFVERLITRARIDTLHNRRLVRAKLFRDDVLLKLFEVVGPRYLDRPGGYVRILKAGFRHGDNAPIAVIELVGRNFGAKGAQRYTSHGGHIFGAKEDEPDDLD